MLCLKSMAWALLGVKVTPIGRFGASDFIAVEHPPSRATRTSNRHSDDTFMTFPFGG
jgi:hypothetical protein